MGNRENGDASDVLGINRGLSFTEGFRGALAVRVPVIRAVSRVEQ